MSAETTPRIAVIGGGSAAEQFCRSVADAAEIIVYEPALVGGECPFVACMPSKAMLHIARASGSWHDAVEHREQVVSGRNDESHVRELADLGVDVRRSRARIAGVGKVEDADGNVEHVDHIVIATGAEAVIPPIDGVDDEAVQPLVWTSDDVLRAFELPGRVAIVGGGVIGFELAELLARFGSEVTVIEQAERSFIDFPSAVVDVITASLSDRGVEFRHGREVTGVSAAAGGARLALDDGTTVDADRVVVAAGKRPRLADIGLDTIGLDETASLAVDRTGRVDADGSVWAIGDVAGWGAYTHLANHEAKVVADQMFGTAQRTFDDVVQAACMFTDPPLITVGPTWSSLRDDPDVVHAEVDLASFPRALTDQIGTGHLWVAARKSSGTVVAAAGAGASFDELVHALVVAVDGAVPVARLRCSMQPFPTIGEVLGSVWDQLHHELTSP